MVDETVTVGYLVAPQLDKQSIEKAQREIDCLWSVYQKEGEDVPAWVRTCDAILSALLTHWNEEVPVDA